MKKKTLIIGIVIGIVISVVVYFLWTRKFRPLLMFSMKSPKKLNFGFHPSPRYTKFTQTGIIPKGYEKIGKKARAGHFKISFNPVTSTRFFLGKRS